VVTQLDRPPELILEAWAIEVRQRARSDANFAEVLDKFESRFGNIKEALNSLDLSLRILHIFFIPKRMEPTFLLFTMCVPVNSLLH